MAVMIVYPKSKDRCTMAMGLAAANKIQSMPKFKKRGEKLTAFFHHTDVSDTTVSKRSASVKRY